MLGFGGDMGGDAQVVGASQQERMWGADEIRGL